jgi:curved DNA-binding protein CbpA
MDDPYKILGVDRTASTEEVRRAYRERAKATHPDVPGGSKEEFRKVQRALTTLADPKKREHYDNTGTDDDGVPDNSDVGAINILVGFFEAAVTEFSNVQGADILQVNLIAAAREWLNESNKALLKQKQQLESKARKLEKVEKRLRRKQSGQASMLNRALRAHIDGLRRNEQAKDRQAAANNAALKLLDEYVFDADQMYSTFGFGGCTTTTTF